MRGADLHSPKTYDLVIAGAGMAGATLANALANLTLPCRSPQEQRAWQSERRPMQIALIESQAFVAGQHPGFDSRAIALSAGSVELLEQLGLWSGMSAYATAIEQILVSDRGHAGHTRIDPSEAGLNALGQVIELQHAGEHLWQQLQDKSNIDLFCPAQLSQVVMPAQAEQPLEIKLSHAEGEQSLACWLLVGADGGHSKVRQALKLEQKTHDFGRTALIANVRTQSPHQGRAYERFTVDGPLAMLPMSEGRSSLVWSLQPEEAERLMALDEADFCHALQQAFGYRLGRIEQAGQRVCYPLILTEAVKPVAHRTVLVGNAAHTLHPIAGQGFNLGLRDVAGLVRVIRDYCQGAGAMHPQSLGNTRMLQDYWQLRQADHRQTIDLTTGLCGVFSNSFAPLVVTRNLGLMAMSLVPGFKQPLLRKTLGQFQLKD